MKKIILIIGLAFAVITAFAQDYYTGKTRVSGNGFAFNVENTDLGVIIIENIQNTQFNQLPYRNDVAGPGYCAHYARFIRYQDVYDVIREVLGATLINKFKAANSDASIEQIFICDPNGNILEIKFETRVDPLTLSIPPTKYYELEQKLKQRIKFNVIRRGNGHDLPIYAGMLMDVILKKIEIQTVPIDIYVNRVNGYYSFYAKTDGTPTDKPIEVTVKVKNNKQYTLTIPNGSTQSSVVNTTMPISKSFAVSNVLVSPQGTTIYNYAYKDMIIDAKPE